jgi:hypothetical protein
MHERRDAAPIVDFQKGEPAWLTLLDQQRTEPRDAKGH